MAWYLRRFGRKRLAY
jgi:hypothetical protein